MQKLQLTIPEPCHENWQQMTPTDQGRFCNACAKEVIDFSTMTDIQVLNYFTNMTHEKVCGRALPEQLDRTISRPAQPKKRLFWYWNYIVMFFMFFGKGNAAKAQGGVKAVTEMSPVKNLDIRGKMLTVGGVKRDGSHVITGKVTDKDGNPVSFASVKIKGTNSGVSADANGAYSLRLQAGAILEIAGAAFKPAEIATGNQNAFSTIMEKDNNQFLGEVLINVTQGASCFGATPRKIINNAAQNIKGDIKINVVGQTRIATVNTDSLYIIDGLVSTKQIAESLSPDDISEIKQLKQSEAMAIYGSAASNGAILITTRKAREIKMKELVVTSDYGMKGRMAGGISFTHTYDASFLGDTIATVKTLLTDSIKVYPNPVQGNTGFSVALKLKQAGNYSIQVTDATGKILLLQKFTATAKDHTEKIMSDSRWAAGIYYIRVFDAQNKLVNKSSFIFR